MTDPFLAALQHQIANKAASKPAKPAADPKGYTPGNIDPDNGPVLITDLIKSQQAAAQPLPARKAGGFRPFRKGKAVSTHGFPSLPPIADLPVDDSFTIELVVDRHRIDIRFTVKPATSILAILKEYGWTWNAHSSVWMHKDCDDNRAFIAHVLNVHITNDDFLDDGKSCVDVTPAAPSVPAGWDVIDTSTPGGTTLAPSISALPVSDSNVVNAPVQAPAQAQAQSYGDDPFAVYCAQVKELCEHLKIDVATLAMRAVDVMHKSTFGRN